MDLYIYDISTTKFVDVDLISDAMRSLVPFAQFKKRENIHGGVLILVKLQALA